MPDYLGGARLSADSKFAAPTVYDEHTTQIYTNINHSNFVLFIITS